METTTYSRVEKQANIAIRLAGNLFLTWAVLTAAYIAGIISGNFSEATLALIGFFVPFGIYNFFLSVMATYAVALAMFFILILVIEKAYNHYQIPYKNRIAYNLVFLFAFTFLLDLILFGKWCSYYFYFGSSSGCGF